MNEEDVGLAKRCAGGDEEALRMIVSRHQKLVFGLACRLLGHRQDAEDVAVTTFSRFWRSAGSYSGGSSLKAYLCRICMNLCSDALKRRVTMSGVSLDDIDEEALHSPHSNPHVITSPSSPTSTTLAPRLTGEAILLELECLPEADRQVLVLYYLEELSYQEICEVVDVSYDVLRTRLTRARARLRAALGVKSG